MAPVKALFGVWRGGPGNNTITIKKDAEGKIAGEWKGSKGGLAGFTGANLKQGMQCRGFWFDNDADVTPAYRLTCTIDVIVDIQGDPSGETIKATYKTKDGGSGTWEAKRFSVDKDIPRTEGKISAFVFKDKKAFDSLTANTWDERRSKLEATRREVFETTAPRPYFDGSGGGGWIPGPGVGAEYETENELRNRLRREDEAHARAMAGIYQEEVDRLNAQIAAGKGDVDNAKKRAEILQKFIEGEKQSEKLRERPKFKPTPAAFSPKASRSGDHIKNEYLDQADLMKHLKKLSEEHEATAGARLEAEIADLEAKLAKGEGNVDVMKARAEMCKRLLQGAKGFAKLKERPPYKPTPGEFHPKEQLEHNPGGKPDTYYSAHDLERKLAKDQADWDKGYVGRLEAEIADLESKVAKGEGNVDGMKSRIEMCKKLIAGAKGAEKLVERKKFKSKPAMSNAKLSPTVMLNPRNVASMMRSMSIRK